MAEGKATHSSSAAMEMAAHRNTFDGFIELVKTTVVHCILALIILAFIYAHAPVTSVLFLILMLATFTVGLLMRRNGWMPGAVLAAFGLLLLAVY
ncbi:MAG: aa3-type cytochrome c oxidase subunit IV [Flavobacteriaceae bacterium]